jgi:UDPglucose 6-dehydrogenase
VFIAVGTPSRRGDGHADLTYVYGAAAEIAKALTGYAVIVTKSTVPVGTGHELERVIGELRPELQFDVVSVPNFCAKARRSPTSKRPDRIVVTLRATG